MISEQLSIINDFFRSWGEEVKIFKIDNLGRSLPPTILTIAEMSQ